LTEKEKSLRTTNTYLLRATDVRNDLALWLKISGGTAIRTASHSTPQPILQKRFVRADHARDQSVLKILSGYSFYLYGLSTDWLFLHVCIQLL
jgi:hypothetical protein